MLYGPRWGRAVKKTLQWCRILCLNRAEIYDYVISEHFFLYRSQQVELSVSELWTEFSEMDFSGTGFVSSDEFKEILMNLCVHLSQYECDLLTRKFDINNDGR